ncbi:MAG: hypothetical protein A2015_10285 [Spirochaetes bacterium GWF1_31_7]|nr:MAG: hypothetical protein A2Y30_05920 [Spirochaetes bacterium GWE1_32_154]OHD49523.1 MAG: hypothetical protein A2Y29_01980 [Spirochaetes bacterium GWE2_31_10]OHD49716.1 MAG: hypothetical protein A2015_10285 [Spirochaetes bacterium GWF1_31_7]OHD77302.1 MAG: hypothetical protein A2355_13880 [Spirochaetes bacterium RIFOXYB1_FULL_32_8]HBD95687.1 hypothetical protein [Spirochaetia bacterium]
MKKLLLTVFILSLVINCKKTELNNSEMRIISLAPSITGILEALSIENDLVGVTDYCITQNKSINKIGGFNNYNLELIAALKPTHILCMDSTSIDMLNTMNTLFGKDTIHPFTHPENFDEIFGMIKRISAIVHKEKEGELIIKTQRNELSALQNTNSLSKSFTGKPKILVEIYYPPFYSAGKNTFLNSMIEAAGCENALQTETKWPTISLEEIFSINPDIILKLNHSTIDNSLMMFKVYEKGNVFQPDNYENFLQPGINSIQALRELKEYLSKR